MPIARISASEYREQASKPAKRKYRNEPVVIDGIRFDSKREGAYYAELKIREKAGEISALKCHPKFKIFSEKGELLATYIADFAYWDHEEDRFRVDDVKGVETAVFRMKKRLMRVMMGIEVEVIR